VTLNTHELAWSAGFLDGEGSWIAAKGDKRYPGLYARILVNQVDRRVLDRLQAALGMGTIGGPYTARNNGISKQPFFVYRLCGFEKVQAATAMLWKFLSPIKQAQARKTLLAVKK